MPRRWANTLSKLQAYACPAHRDELRNQCFEDLMVQVRHRLEEDVLRLGSAYAHVLNESIDSKHDDRSQAWP